MFGGSPPANASGSPGSKTDDAARTDQKAPSPRASPKDIGSVTTTTSATTTTRVNDHAASGEKRSGNGSPPTRQATGGSTDKKRRSSSVSNKASSLLASAKNSLSFSQLSRSNSGGTSPIHKLGRQDPALAVPQGQHNNSAGESVPGPKSTFRVGVWEDRNKKCRRTMEDTHSFLYNFLASPSGQGGSGSPRSEKPSSDASSTEMVESDNGYFAIFDGHAGTFAADWCGKKLHVILEDVIKRNPKVPLPELLDQTFTTVDAQLEKLPLKNSGCTAAIAVLRWESRPSSDRAGAGPAIALPIAPKKPNAADGGQKADGAEDKPVKVDSSTELDGAAVSVSSKSSSSRQRVLYTANVGDARIILCRNGKALRLSYDHKGSDENEGKRISNAGGLILNNRVNGVLAVTRALGDAYMKDLVTGHPYTTETVIQPDLDEFLIIACDGLWDVCSDQAAVDLVRNVQDPTAASKQLVEHAISNLSTDNLSCMIVRLDKEATAQGQKPKKSSESDSDSNVVGASEADKIVLETKQKIAEGSTPALGVSATNSGRGYDPVTATPLDEAVEEVEEDEEAAIESELDGPEVQVPDEEAVKTEPAKNKPVL